MKLPMLVLLVSFAAFGQEHGEHKGFPPPKNLKLLKPEHLMETMGAFRVALGVRCDFCHVQGDFASDEKPQKEIARKMITMVHDINGHFPDGKMHVTCFTCHRGAEEPATHPPDAAQPAH